MRCGRWNKRCERAASGRSCVTPTASPRRHVGDCRWRLRLVAGWASSCDRRRLAGSHRSPSTGFWCSRCRRRTSRMRPCRGGGEWSCCVLESSLPRGQSSWNSAMARMVCVWLPNWAVQRLRHERPELRGRPVVLFANDGNRSPRVAAWVHNEAQQCNGEGIKRACKKSCVSFRKQIVPKHPLFTETDRWMRH